MVKLMFQLSQMKKILINALTLTRIPLTILFIILIINSNKSLELLILFLILLSDFIDGKIFRKSIFNLN